MIISELQHIEDISNQEGLLEGGYYYSEYYGSDGSSYSSGNLSVQGYGDDNVTAYGSATIVADTSGYVEVAIVSFYGTATAN